MSRKLSSVSTPDLLRKEAKRWLKALRQNDPEARRRFESAHPAPRPSPGLRDVQLALAREYGQPGWTALKKLASLNPSERAAHDFVSAYEGDETALARLNQYYDRTFSMPDLKAEIWRRVYAFRERSSRVPKNFLKLEEARAIVAQDAGFSNWETMLPAIASGTPPPGPTFEIDSQTNRVTPRRRLKSSEWDALCSEIKERGLSGIDANGIMTDAGLELISKLDHVTSLRLGGSRELTDDGLLLLARMPQLEHLDLSEYPGGKITDRGLAVLRHLPNLRTFEMTWQAAITDAGVSNLQFCHHLEEVDLMGSPTGDGAIEALQGKPNLYKFSSGRLVTDKSLPLLHNFPLLKNWVGAPFEARQDEPSPKLGRLLLDGPFTNQGLAGLAGLAGVFELDLFWHVTGITTNGYVHLAQLPNLRSMGCDGRLSDDTAMQHLANFPRLARLRIQESIATDAGFQALSQSKTINSIWGRRCPNFGSRGFLAFSKMPALRRLGIGCGNVSDEALSRLPNFPSLRELTPIDVHDAGFRYIGACPRLERLTCMYCRDTTDLATDHIANLNLKYYYAGLTQITDRSLALLGKMSSLEKVEFYECQHITDAGLPYLATLSNLKELNLEGCPGITFTGIKAIPGRVRVHYSV